MKPDLHEILTAHAAWLADPAKGRRANLSGADLRRADLRRAVLSGADLSEADLSEANLRGAVLSEANLRGADLSGANLSGADLSEADLSEANLRRADLSESTGVLFAQVAWTGHGERGRQLSAVMLAEGLRFFCGCFQGTEADLRAYIAAGDDACRESRTKALDFLLSCF